MTKKRFLMILLSTVVLLVMIDLVVGQVMHWYVLHKNIPGDYGKIEYMLKRADAQILLLGASTCMNSIDPELLEGALKKSVFNGGLNDQRLEFFDVISEAIFKRSPPKMLILVLRRNDLVVSDRGRLDMMSIYYHIGDPKLDWYLNEGKLEKRILLCSSLYRFNTYSWRILLYHFKSFNELAHGGFVGKPVPKFFPRRWKRGNDKNATVSINRRKLQCLENILKNCRLNGTRMWIVIAPEYYDYGSDENIGGTAYIRDFCRRNNIRFINDSQHPDFVDHPEYFFDNNHLNVNGAKIYTKHILRMLREEGV